MKQLLFVSVGGALVRSGITTFRTSTGSSVSNVLKRCWAGLPTAVSASSSTTREMAFSCRRALRAVDGYALTRHGLRCKSRYSSLDTHALDRGVLKSIRTYFRRRRWVGEPDAYRGRLGSARGCLPFPPLPPLGGHD